MNYKIQLEKFEGPLDLLLYFIRRDELDIKGNMLIKGVRFEGLRVIGESTNFAKEFPIL